MSVLFRLCKFILVVQQPLIFTEPVSVRVQQGLTDPQGKVSLEPSTVIRQMGAGAALNRRKEAEWHIWVRRWAGDSPGYMIFWMWTHEFWCFCFGRAFTVAEWKCWQTLGYMTCSWSFLNMCIKAATILWEPLTNHSVDPEKGESMANI